MSGIQWVASEAWVTAGLLTTPHFHPLLEGTLGFSFPGVRIPGLKEFLLNVRPSPNAGMEFVNMFWEEQFGCKLMFAQDRSNENKAKTAYNLSHSDAFGYNKKSLNNSGPILEEKSLIVTFEAEKPLCTGSEDLTKADSSYINVSQVRISYNVYKAVYAIAHALHSLLKCNSAESICEKHKSFTSEQVSVQKTYTFVCLCCFI